MEYAQKKRREKDNEWHLIAQINELHKELARERLLKVEEEKVVESSQPKQRLIVVANRLPVTPRRTRDTNEWRFDRSSGGLVSAFLGVKGMEITWVGWVGAPVPKEEQGQVTAQLKQQQPFPCVPVYLDADAADHFYNGFCNNVLWPLLHYIPLSMLDSQASVAELQWQVHARRRAGHARRPTRPLPSRDVSAVLGDVSHACLLALFRPSRHGGGVRCVRRRRARATRLVLDATGLPRLQPRFLRNALELEPVRDGSGVGAGLPSDAAASHAP